MSEPSEFFDQEDEAETKIIEPVESITKEQIEDAVDAVVEATEEASGIRDYVVLVRDQSGAWQEVETVRATTPTNAIESLGEKKLVDGAKYVAPPARFWRPVTASVKVTTEIKIGQ